MRGTGCGVVATGILTILDMDLMPAWEMFVILARLFGIAFVTGVILASVCWGKPEGNFPKG